VQAAFGNDLVRLAGLHRQLIASLALLLGAIVALGVAGPVISQMPLGAKVALGVLLLGVNFWHWFTLGRVWRILSREAVSWPAYIVLSLALGALLLIGSIVASIGVTRTFRRCGFRPVWPLLGPSPKRVKEFLQDSVCRHCGYDLTGNISGRCPECGTAC
jgi:hypothetical protein